MITTLPAVQWSCKRVKRYICFSSRHAIENLSRDKRHANRQHRRYLNRATRRIQHDTELWYGECFNAPTLSSWDLW